MVKSKERGYDPIKLAKQTEKIVIKSNMRKYANLARRLRFYNGVISATEVGCNLRCKFCFSDKPVWDPRNTGSFYSPIEVFNGLSKMADKYKCNLISASASEGTLGREHLFELLDLVEQSKYIYIVETNGMILGHDKSFSKQLSNYSRVHVRVSIKGANRYEFSKLTGAKPSSYDLPFKALKHLITNKVSCNACAMISFSNKESISKLKNRISDVWPGLLKSLELEHITMFPKVVERLRKYKIEPNTIKRGKNVISKNRIVMQYPSI